MWPSISAGIECRTQHHGNWRGCDIWWYIIFWPLLTKNFISTSHIYCTISSSSNSLSRRYRKTYFKHSNTFLFWIINIQKGKFQGKISQNWALLHVTWAKFRTEQRPCYALRSNCSKWYSTVWGGIGAYARGLLLAHRQPKFGLFKFPVQIIFHCHMSQRSCLPVRIGIFCHCHTGCSIWLWGYSTVYRHDLAHDHNLAHQ